MVEFINNLTGTRMLVAEDREAEYLAAGHRRVDAYKNATERIQSSSSAKSTSKRKTTARK